MSPTGASGPRLRALVLGSGAGGGVPQWNCGCRVCRLAWSGDLRVKPRTQAGLERYPNALNRRDSRVSYACPAVQKWLAAEVIQLGRSLL
jgi:hypothetical protein